jgi:large subunit ribosomal protein L5
MKLSERFKKEIVPDIKNKLNKKNIFEVPVFEKVVFNIGVGRDHKDKNFLEMVENNLIAMSGQKPVRTKAKKSISNFKIRKGMEIGFKVTLRGKRMLDFIEKLVIIILPRIRDFKGLSLKNVDKDGNLNIGFKEQIAFPEIPPKGIERLHGLELTIVTLAQSRDDAIELYKTLNFPFKEFLNL